MRVGGGGRGEGKRTRARKREGRLPAPPPPRSCATHGASCPSARGRTWGGWRVTGRRIDRYLNGQMDRTKIKWMEDGWRERERETDRQTDRDRDSLVRHPGKFEIGHGAHTEGPHDGSLGIAAGRTGRTSSSLAAVGTAAAAAARTVTRATATAWAGSATAGGGWGIKRGGARWARSGGGDPDAIGGGRRRAGRWGGRGRLGPRGGSGRGGVRPPCALRPWARQRLAPRKEHCVHSPRVKKAVSHLRVGANHAARPWGLAATWAPVGRGRAELATPARARPGARAGARRGSPPSAVGICPTTGLREVA